MKNIFILMLAVLVAAVSHGNEKKKPKAQAPTGNYRQSTTKKTNTIKNIHAITAKKEVQDKAATAAYQAFMKTAATHKKGKKYSAIISAADKLIASQKKLTKDQQAYVLYYKTEAYYLMKQYDEAVESAKNAMTLAGSHASKHAAMAIRAAMLQKNNELAGQIVENFENSPYYADGFFYAAASDYYFTAKRYDDALRLLRLYGKQPNLTLANKVQIYSGFGKYFEARKNYKKAIAQYEAIKKIPRVDARNAGNADIRIAKCYMLMENKEKALEVYRAAAKSKDGSVRNTANSEIKKLTAKPRPAKKKPAPKKKK